MDSLAQTHPHLAAEWSPKNEKAPTDLTYGSGYRADWVCRLGHGWNARVCSRVTYNSGCPFCANKAVLPGFNDLATTDPDLAEQWSSRNEFNPSEVTRGSTKRVEWVCGEGHRWSGTVNARTNHRTICPTCTGRKTVTGVNDLASLRPDLAAQWSLENDLTPSDVTTGSKYRCEWVCDKGHTWFSTVKDRVRGSGCPQCDANTYVSKGERELADWLSGYTPVETSNRKALSGTELDIYLPDAQVAVEFNGVYWHAEKFVGKSRHAEKTQKCADAGINLIHVWEDDWRDKPEVVKRMILRKAGLSQEERVNARDLSVVELTVAQAREFLDANHIQGYGSGRGRFGLVDGDGRVRAALVVLARAGGTHEIVRFATNSLVRGGFSKLLKHAERLLGVREWVTFAAKDVSTGGLYEASGFVVTKELPPDYSYVVSGRREHKFNYRLEKFREDPALKYVDGLTERELAELNGLDRVWDAGKVRYSKVVG